MAQFLKFLTEGGNAISFASRINQTNVKETLEDIYDIVFPELKLNKTDKTAYVVLGSAGKKKDNDSSGDLDIAISINHIKKEFNLKSDEDVIKKISDVVKKVSTTIQKNSDKKSETFYKLMPGLMTFSLAFPIHNTNKKQDNEYVQVDFMPSDNIDLVGWAMSSPHHTESSTKGLVRNELFQSMIKYSDMKSTLDDDGEPLEVKRYYFNPKSGLYYVTQTRKIGKSGKPIKGLQITDKKLITSNKDKIMEFLFGSGIKALDVMTFEQLWTLFKSKKFKFPSKRKEIEESFRKNIKDHGIKLSNLD